MLIKNYIRYINIAAYHDPTLRYGTNPKINLLNKITGSYKQDCIRKLCLSLLSYHYLLCINSVLKLRHTHKHTRTHTHTHTQTHKHTHTDASTRTRIHACMYDAHTPTHARKLKNSLFFCCSINDMITRAKGESLWISIWPKRFRRERNRLTFAQKNAQASTEVFLLYPVNFYMSNKSKLIILLACCIVIIIMITYLKSTSPSPSLSSLSTRLSKAWLVKGISKL